MPSRALVRVSVLAGRPAAEQLTLLVQRDGAAGEPAGLAGGQFPGGVGEDDLAVAGEAEELPQRGQPPLAAAGQGAEEGLDVAHVGQRPVVLAAVVEEDGEVAGGGQGGLDRGPRVKRPGRHRCPGIRESP
jgi:hypothetical protein